MKTLKSDWLIWLMLVIPFVFIAMYWKQFPDQIATHFDMDGNPNDYSSKAFGLFILPGINLALYLLFAVIPKVDPKKANYTVFNDKFRIVRIVLHVFFTFGFFVSSFYALGYHFNFGKLMIYGVMMLFLILGNYMGNIRQNFFIGVRTPWTLSNEEVWTKTHRTTARLWVIASLLMMAVFPLLPHPKILFGVYLAIVSVVPIVYSYILYRKIKGN